jgi:hypothetical protein
MTDKAMTAVERVERWLNGGSIYTSAPEKSDIRELLTLARQSVGVEEIDDLIDAAKEAERDMHFDGARWKASAKELTEKRDAILSRITGV